MRPVARGPSAELANEVFQHLSDGPTGRKSLSDSWGFGLGDEFCGAHGGTLVQAGARSQVIVPLPRNFHSPCVGSVSILRTLIRVERRRAEPAFGRTGLQFACARAASHAAAL